MTFTIKIHLLNLKKRCLRQSSAIVRMIESHPLKRKKGLVELKIKLKMKKDLEIQQRLMRLMKLARMAMVEVMGSTG
jgi:hypothetical protein